jgi:hypothetical protein
MAIRNRAPLELMLDTGLLRRGHLNGTTQGEHEAPLVISVEPLGLTELTPTPMRRLGQPGTA